MIRASLFEAPFLFSQVNMKKKLYEAYAWEDLVAVFPKEFHGMAQDFLCYQDSITFGDAEYTLIHGSLAYALLDDAWDEWPDHSEYNKDDFFTKLPALTDGSLVALLG